MLTGEKAAYRGVAPTQPFDRSNGHAGARFELTARYDGSKVDDDAFPLFANPASAATRGARRGSRRELVSEPRREDHGGNTRDITFDGGAPDGGDRPTERGVFTRLQVGF